MRYVYKGCSQVRLTAHIVHEWINVSEISRISIFQSWQLWESNDIKKVHTQYIKRILGLNRSTTKMLVRAEVGRFSLQTKALQRNIKNIKYLRNKSDDELAKHTLLYEQTKSTSRATIENTI